MTRIRQVPRRMGRAPRRVPPLPKVADAFYVSKEWRSLVARLKRERGSWCEKCGAGGKGVRIIGDHIVERRDGGAELDPGNIELLCGGCHAVKTAAAKAARVGAKMEVGGGQNLPTPNRR